MPAGHAHCPVYGISYELLSSYITYFVAKEMGPFSEPVNIRIVLQQTRLFLSTLPWAYESVVLQSKYSLAHYS